MTTMFIYGGCNESIPADTEAYYETVASQEEIYLEQTEEELRLTLESDDPLPLSQESPNQQREHAVGELTAGDFDDSPLGEDTVKEMLLDNNQSHDAQSITSRVGNVRTTLYVGGGIGCEAEFGE